MLAPRTICHMFLVGHFADSSLARSSRNTLLWQKVQHHPGYHLSWGSLGPSPLTAGLDTVLSISQLMQLHDPFGQDG